MALDIVRVDSIGQAAGMLAGDDGARFLAGGTFLVRALSAGDGSIRKFVLADGLGLDRITLGDDITIGSAVTMAQVAKEPGLAFLAPVAESIGGPAVRNMATVGGNLFARSPYGDFAVALLALGATVVSETRDGEKVEDLEAFIADGPKRGGSSARYDSRRRRRALSATSRSRESIRMARRCCRSRRCCR